MTTKSYTNTHSYSYNGNGINGGTGSKRLTDGSAYQGYYPGIGRGSQFSYVLFDYATIANDLSGATITKIELTITDLHAYFGAGIEAMVGWSTRTSFPSSITTHTGDTMDKQEWGPQVGTDNGGGAVTTTLGAWAGTAFQSSSATSLMFGNDSTQNNSFYGYWDGAAGHVTLKFTFTTVAGPSFPNSTVPNGTVNVSYSTTNTEATIAAPPATYSVSAGSLAPGLGLNTSSGLLSGTPTKAGSYSFTVKAVDDNSNSATQAFTQTISAQTGGSGGSAPPVSGPYPLTEAVISSASTTSGAMAVQTSGYTGDTYCIIVSSMDSTTGRAETSTITDTQGNTYTLKAKTFGSPTGLGAEPEVEVFVATNVTALVAGTDTVTVTMARSELFSVEGFGIVGGGTFDQLTFNSGTSTAPMVTSTTLGHSFELAFGTWTNGLTSSTFSSPVGPNTLLNTATSVSNAPWLATYWENVIVTTAVTFSGTLSSSTTWQAIILTFEAPPPIISASAFGNGTVGSRYSSSAGVAKVSYGTTTYAITAGSLPPGLSIASATGVVSGIPTTAGIFSFGITITDGNAQTSSKSGTITIGPLAYGFGANNVLPTVPLFVQAETSIPNLNNLGYATDFLCDDNTRPVYKAFKPFTTALSGTGWTTVSGGNVAFDSDGQGGTGTSNMDVNITTTGYYCCEAAASVMNASASHTFKIRFLFTAGAPNPVYATGVTIPFGQRTTGTQNATGSDTSLCTTDICPVICYPGDSIAMQVYVDNTALNTIDFNNNAAFNEGRFVISFSTYYLRVGG